MISLFGLEGYELNPGNRGNRALTSEGRAVTFPWSTINALMANYTKMLKNCVNISFTYIQFGIKFAF